ncbi:hypothetical protein PIB30_078829 [Stylosanthes scabra]|uniref:Transmembrane protein n=1 Tax=Stylosanthes scabra TaxID=79078 RepID=A0ABU6VUG5_9FABA|nr:hypothetical protein [Stylosanthes scabra]
MNPNTPNIITHTHTQNGREEERDDGAGELVPSPPSPKRRDRERTEKREREDPSCVNASKRERELEDEPPSSSPPPPKDPWPPPSSSKRREAMIVPPSLSAIIFEATITITFGLLFAAVHGRSHHASCRRVEGENEGKKLLPPSMSVDAAVRLQNSGVRKE